MAEAHHGPNEYALDDHVAYSARQLLIDDAARDSDIHLASVAEKKRLWWKNAVINTFFIASWFFFATILSVYNKWMFSPEHYGFSYPLFVTTLHMFIQFVLAATLRAIWPRRFRPELSPTKSDFAKKVVPTAITTGLDIGLSNVSLKIITLSFYTMCKSSSLIFVLLFAFLFKLEKFSLRLIGVITLIFCGVLLMVATETHFVLSGFILVLSASALGGLRWSLTQLLLKSKKMGMDNPAATIYWLAPVMGITLAILSAIFDNWVTIFGSKFFQDVSTSFHTVFFLISPGVVAFLMVLSEFYILQRVGVVPMSIAGIAKEVATISVSAWFFGDELTPLNITGVVITICGIGLFTYHKYRKSLDSAVPLDVHGNPADDLIAAGSSREEVFPLELAETQHLTSASARVSIDFEMDDTSINDRSQLLFSAEPGEEDADDIRSIRSSNIRWHSANGAPRSSIAPVGDVTAERGGA